MGAALSSIPSAWRPNRPRLRETPARIALAAPREICERRVSEDRYRQLIHHAPTALWHVDARSAGEVFDRLRAEGVTDLPAYLDEHPNLVETAQDIILVTEVNRAAVALFGARDPGELVGPVRYLFTATPGMARRVMIAHFEGRRSFLEQARIVTADGRSLDVKFCVTFPAPPELLDTSLITIEDITDRLAAEAQIRRLQTEFSHAARISTLGELATSIAHEVKQPLAAIVTNAETSLRWLARESPDMAKAAQLISRVAASAQRANDIILRIQAMALKHEPEMIVLDLNEVVEEALHFVRHDLETRSILLSTRLDPALPTICGDRVQLQQVIVNLLVNSIQAMACGEGEGRPGRRIEVTTTPEGEEAVTFTIHDTGPGIAEPDLAHIFEGFFTTKPTGTGIGLAICRSIIASHGGEISAANHLRGGAVFRVCLPVAAI